MNGKAEKGTRNITDSCWIYKTAERMLRYRYDCDCRRLYTDSYGDVDMGDHFTNINFHYGQVNNATIHRVVHHCLWTFFSLKTNSNNDFYLLGS